MGGAMELMASFGLFVSELNEEPAWKGKLISSAPLWHCHWVLLDVIKTQQNDYLHLKRKVRSLESNNQNVDSKKLENFHAKKAAFLRDVEELQSHRRVVEDFQDAEALCELASFE
ncbi:hypothetical protein PS2_031765 [Malus domestica]